MNGRRIGTVWTTSLAAVALTAWGGECLAQGSLFGNRGPTGGQASFGGTSSFGRAGTSGYGTSSNRGAFSGASGFGGTSSFGGIQSGLGSTAGFGQGGQVQGSTLGLGQNTFGQASGFGQAATGAMVGRSNTGTFIGAGQLGQQQAFQQFGNFGQFNRGSARTQQNQGNNRNQQTQQRTVRPRQRVAFDYDAPAAAAVNDVVRTRIEQLSTRRPELESVSFVLEPSGLARLRGSVPDAEAARLAEALVRLEPGVQGVENELIVAGSAGTN